MRICGERWGWDGWDDGFGGKGWDGMAWKERKRKGAKEEGKGRRKRERERERMVVNEF